MSAPQPRGPYSMVTVAPRGARFAHLSGLTGRRLDGTIAAAAEQQTTDAFANVESLLESMAAEPVDIAHSRSYLVGSDTLTAFNTARDAVFSRWFDGAAPPSHTLLIVAGLADPEAFVEVEIVVALPDGFDQSAFDMGDIGK